MQSLERKRREENERKYREKTKLQKLIEQNLKIVKNSRNRLFLMKKKNNRFKNSVDQMVSQFNTFQKE